MEIVKRISLDFNEKSSAPVVDVVQGDSARCLELVLTRENAPWAMPANAAVLVRYVKPDGTGGVYDTLPNGEKAWSVHENVVRVALTEQLCAVSGAVLMQLVIMAGEKQLSTFPVVLRVCSEVAGVGDSQDYINLTTWLEKYGQGGSAHVDDRENPHGVTAQQVGAYEKGDNIVGLLGYYYSAIDFESKTVTLSKEQGEAVVPEEIAWAVGDVVSIVNGGKYEQCAIIVGIDGHVLTLDNIPFDKLDPTIKDFDDRSIYVSAKPEAGVADFGKGAIAMGVHNKSLNRGAVTLGEDNEVTAQYGTAIGRLNKVHGYAGFANGRENVVHPGAKYGRTSGLKNQVWGEESVAEGHECKANAKGARATGYKTAAKGEYSETAGWEAETTERASYSFAGGQKTVADAWYAFVTGLRTISSNLYGHFVTGRYNKVVSELFTIGCGTSDDNRQNALGVKLDGTTDVYGHKITNVAEGTVAGDAVNMGQLDKRLVEDANYPGCYYRVVNGVKEWLNPPMTIGGEYRTTERYNGKPVYAKAVQLDLSTAGSKYVYISTEMTSLVSLEGHVKYNDSGMFMPIINYPDGHFIINEYGNLITNDITAEAVAYAILKYTK